MLVTPTRGLAMAALVLAGACGSGITETDSRFATPERTVETLLTSYGVEALSQEEIQARMAERGAFELRDPETFHACFVDVDQPGGDGMAGYVFGLIAAAKDDLRYETIEDHGYVIPREGIRVVMDRGADGAYRISLRRSVPEDVRRGLIQVEQNAAHRAPD